MYLIDELILEMSIRPGVKNPYSIIHYLTGLHKGINFSQAVALAQLDAKDNKWNTVEIEIVCDAIDLFYRQAIPSRDKTFERN